MDLKSPRQAGATGRPIIKLFWCPPTGQKFPTRMGVKQRIAVRSFWRCIDLCDFGFMVPPFVHKRRHTFSVKTSRATQQESHKESRTTPREFFEELLLTSPQPGSVDTSRCICFGIEKDKVQPDVGTLT